MTKNNYFYFLWALVSVSAVISLIVMFASGYYLDETAPAELSPSIGIALEVIAVVVSIFFRGFILTMALHFAQKIRAPLLLWYGNYNFKKDILKPALIVGVVVSCIVCAINIAWPFELFSDLEGVLLPFDKIWIILSRLVVYDINLLLFWIAGFALLITKVTKTDATDLIVYASIVLIALLSNMSLQVWQFGMVAFTAGLIVRTGIDIVLGVLFWKKGLETAMLCHLVIVLSFYIIAPMVMRAIAA